MTYDLFSDEMTNGFHLEFFQLLNWGVFDKKVYTLNCDNKSALLTGINGSGKTTIVDALTTLLVPNTLRFYNQSSGDGRKRDRTENSYVLGAYGNVQNEDSAGSNTQYLRKRDEVISVLNGCFYDQSKNKHVTLLQVRYFSGAELQRVFAITEQRLSLDDIQTILQKSDSKIDRSGKWKNLLKSQAGTQFFDSFEKYKAQYTSLFGFRSDKALKLFSQIIGLKVLGNLTDFIRENMLEKTDADVEFQKLERNYENLLQSERTILKTKKQIEMLEPVIEAGKKLQAETEKRERLIRLRDAVSAWKTKTSIDILSKKKTELEGEIAKQNENKKFKEQESAQLEEAIRSLQADIDNTESSRRIAQIDSEVNNLRADKERKLQLFSQYKTDAELLELSIPHSAAEFEQNQTELHSLETTLREQKNTLDKQKTDLSIEARDIREEKETVQKELESLGKRNSNIPEENIRIRHEICLALGCAEEALPFAGELLQVLQGQEKWNFAIERLLHNFALTVLVSEDLYKRVTDYVKNHNIGGRLVYLRTQEAFSLGSDLIIAEENTVLGKLEVKQNHPLTEWINRYLYEHFNYRCTDDINEIAHTERAITTTGLIKSGIKHEKDDRKKITQNFTPVLGWDNTRKRQILSKQYDDLCAKETDIQAQLTDIESKLTLQTKQDFALQSLAKVLSWEAIDYESVATKIDSLQDERKRLVTSKDIAQLQALLDGKKNEKQRIDSARDDILGLINRYDDRLKNTIDSLLSNNKNWQELSQRDDFETVILSSIDELCEEYPRLTKATSVPMAEDAGNKMTSGLEGNITTSNRTISAFIKNLRDAMTKVKHPQEKLRELYGNWESEFNDMEANEDFLPDYQNFYNRLKKDDLPKYEKQFHDFLHNSIKDDIINFNQFINFQKEEIEKAVHDLNQNLRQITYYQNPDTYLSLKCERNADPRISEFNIKLKNAIPDTVRIQQQDTEYEEQLFTQIKAFLESLKENQNLREFVLDIRNWFTFAASENYCQDNQQKQYYSDSASLSGGEKAKLTYTILASAISYQFGINSESCNSFRFVIIDEAFSKSDAMNSEYAMKLFKQLDLQLMVITPLDKINIVEDYISSVHMTENKNTNDSRLISMTIEKYKERKEELQEEKAE